MKIGKIRVICFSCREGNLYIKIRPGNVALNFGWKIFLKLRYISYSLKGLKRTQFMRPISKQFQTPSSAVIQRCRITKISPMVTEKLRTQTNAVKHPLQKTLAHPQPPQTPNSQPIKKQGLTPPQPWSSPKVVPCLNFPYFSYSDPNLIKQNKNNHRQPYFNFKNTTQQTT